MSAIGGIAIIGRHWHLMDRSRMTQQRHSLCTAAMVLMSFSAPIKVLVKTDTMPSPELGGGHEAARVHHAFRRRDCVAARGTGPATAEKSSAHWHLALQLAAD